MTDYAFSEALAGESLPDELRFSDVPREPLLKYARTVAYKVYHNLRLGYPMDPSGDPIRVDGVPAPEAWPEHYAEPHPAVPRH